MSFSNEYTLNVDIEREISNKVPTFRQGDNARLKFKVFDNGKAFDLTSFTDAEITFKTPAGNVIIGNPVLEEGYIVYDFQGVEMERVGKITTILSLYSENTVVSVQPFAIFIYDSMKNENLSYIGILQELINSTQLLEMDTRNLLSEITNIKDVLLEVENIRVESENDRIANEAVREGSEVIRENNEDTRENNEIIRLSEENSRKSYEETRQNEENIRKSNESTRILNENNRVTSEANRVHLGEFNITTTYNSGNEATYNGSTYRAKVQSVGVIPEGNSNWILVSSKGTNGTGQLVSKTETFTATENQTVFTLTTGTYEMSKGRLQVLVGGVPQFSPMNYTETSNTKITLSEALPVGMSVIITYSNVI